MLFCLVWFLAALFQVSVLSRTTKIKLTSAKPEAKANVNGYKLGLGNYPEPEDNRTEEDKRFYLKSSWTPQSGKFPSLDYFINLMRKKFDDWIQPRRIKDNMNESERME